MISNMPSSPRGREIKEVDGDPWQTISRGSQIERLGGNMRESATLLETIQSRAGDQQGKAIDSLRDSIGDSYEVLFEAADLYEPVGPVIAEYGRELRDVQPTITGHVGNCEDLWSAYESTGGNIPPRGSGGWGQPDADSDEAEENAEQDQAKQEAFDAWKAEAESFDSAYDTWEDAFETAVDNIGDEMAGTIKDSFWDKVADILSVAALILGVAAFFIGGWVVAAIALAVSAALLLVTTIQYFQGDKSLLDVGLAALGVIPVGKLANLTKLAHGGRGIKAFGDGALGNIAKLKPANGFQRLHGQRFAEKAFKFNGWGGGFKNAAMGSGGFKSVHREHMKMYFGPAGREAFQGGQNAIRNLARIDFSLQFAGNIGSWSGRVGSVTDWNDPAPNWLGALI